MNRRMTQRRMAADDPNAAQPAAAAASVPTDSGTSSSAWAWPFPFSRGRLALYTLAFAVLFFIVAMPQSWHYVSVVANKLRLSEVVDAGDVSLPIGLIGVQAVIFGLLAMLLMFLKYKYDNASGN
jgi:hypothetical protein